MEYKKLIQNRRSSKSEEYCFGVLGSENQLGRAATLWKNYKDLFTLISTAELVEFCTEDKIDYDTREIKAFKAGLAAIPSFLALSSMELEQLRKKKAARQAKEK